MKDPWQPYLQLGVVHFMAFPECLGGEGPQFETLKQICHDGFFEAVDVGPIYDTSQRRECAALLRDCQMTVTFACQPLQLQGGLDLNAADETERKRALDVILNLIGQAKEIGATRLALMSGKNVTPEQRRAALERLYDSLRRICRAARDEAGLPVVLEIFDYDVDKKALVGPCAMAATVARAIKTDFPDFGLLHDLSHIYLCHEEPAKHFPLIRNHLVGMHMGNSVSARDHPLFGDTHPLFGMPGGDCDVPELRDFIRALFDIGYLSARSAERGVWSAEERSTLRAPRSTPKGQRPVCAFEIKPPDGVSPETAIANMKRTWQRAWWEL